MKTSSWISMSAAAVSSSSSSSSGSLIVVGLNAALQKRFVLSGDGAQLIPGNVHRASQVQTGVGGKGQDVAIALSCLPYQSHMQLAQFVGSGAEGDAVYELLQDRFQDDSVLSLTVRPKSHMRTCTTIVGSDVSTELVEPSGIIQEEEMQELLSIVSASTIPISALCIMGSMPPGCPEETYATIFGRICNKEMITLIDSVVGLEPLLETIASSSQNRGPTILKLNAAELCRLAKVETSSEGEADGIEADELIDGAMGLLRQFDPYAAAALDGIAVTDGKHAAHFVHIDKDTKELRIFRLSVPVLDSSRTLYPIGAGDTVAAGTLAAWKCLVEQAQDGAGNGCLDESIQSELLKNMQMAQSLGDESVSTEAWQMVSAFAFGLSCGSASCLEEQNSIFQGSEAISLYRHMTPALSIMSVPLTAA
jgi:1-phosphofructokinase